MPLLIVLHLHLQPPVEYTDELLGMLATFEGMILRREGHLALMGMQVLSIFPVFSIVLITYWF